jgi:hypothetical protein
VAGTEGGMGGVGGVAGHIVIDEHEGGHVLPLLIYVAICWGDPTRWGMF